MKIITEINDYIGYKIEIFPTEEQKSIFNRYFGTARYVYNLGIDIMEKNKEETGKYLSFYSLNKEFTKLKYSEEYSWLNEFDSTTLKLVLQDVCYAYKNFLNNSKHFEKPIYKTKKLSELQFPTRSDRLLIQDNQLRISTIGFVDYYNSYGDKILGNSRKEYNNNYIKFTNPRISKKGSRYYLSFTIPKDEDHNINSYQYYGGNQEWQEQESSKAIGIDVGLKHDKWLKDSTGKTVQRPKCEKEYERIKFYQQKLNRQYETNKDRDPRTFKNRQPIKGRSKNMQKTIDKINKLYDKITNKRHAVVHEYCKELLEQKPEAVVMEDIKVLSFVVKDDDKNCNYQKQKTNSLIEDAALYDTKMIIQNTMVNNGIKVIYADSQYPSSQICSNCGCIHKFNVNTKYYRCPECGMVMDRDFNAAVNLSNLAYLKCPVKRLGVE